MTVVDPSKSGLCGTENVRTDWTRAEIAALFDLPFTELVFRAAEVHRAHHRAGEVQLCTLLSIKTGGCPEDCGYCSQSVSADSGVEDRKSTRLNSSHSQISYAVFCLKKKKKKKE